MDIVTEKQIINIDHAENACSISIGELVDQLIKDPKPTYVVGAGIRDFVAILNDFEMRTYWDTVFDNKEFVDLLRYHRDSGIEGQTASMYAYIDYVLEETDKTLLLFVPSLCRTSELPDSPTRDEMIRAVGRMEEFPGRIVFVTGFYDWVGV